ncbi:MAG: hypothetical protein WCK73_03025 [Deltaproteobacteria bacterium]
MPTCALCENVQAAGDSCSVCDQPFREAEPAPEPVERLEGLEATRLPASEVSAERLAELEATAVGPVVVDVLAMDDLVPTVAEGLPGEEPAATPSAPVCRYCRNPAVPGEAFCVHCGMRLPAAATGPSRDAAGAPSPVLCRDCGTPLKGSSCSACGARASG